MAHPLLTFLERVDHALDGYVDTAMFGLDDDDLAAARMLVNRIGNRFDATDLALAHETQVRDRDAKTLWVRQTHQTPKVAAGRLKLAAALDAREPLRAAMAAGDVSEAQSRVVVAALDRLPADLGAEKLAEAEATMVGLCAHHDPDELRRLGRHLFQVAAPGRAEAEEAARVEAEYRRAMEKRRLELWDRGDGTWGLKGTLPAFHGHLLDKILKAYTAPRHQRACGTDDTGADGERLDAGQRRGAAFCEFLERFPYDAMPHAGGVSARVVVNIDLDDLTTRLTEYGIVSVDGMVDIPAWEGRRMACEAGLLPVVLGGKSEVLDLGRSRRFHNEPQRTAIHLRDKTCRAEGCDWPASMGHIHHPVAWKAGGNTDLTGMSLCPHHHARAHDPTYEMRTGKNGKVVFSRR